MRSLSLKKDSFQDRIVSLTDPINLYTMYKIEKTSEMPDVGIKIKAYKNTRIHKD